MFAVFFFFWSSHFVYCLYLYTFPAYFWMVHCALDLALSPPVIISVTITALSSSVSILLQCRHQSSSVSLLQHYHHQCHYCCTVITSVTIAALSSSVSLLLHCHHQCHYCCTVITRVTIAALSSSASLLLHCHHQSSVSLTLQRHRQNDCSDKAEDT